MTVSAFAKRVGQRADELALLLLFGPSDSRSFPVDRPYAAEFGIWGAGVLTLRGDENVVVFVDGARFPRFDRSNFPRLVPVLEVDAVREALRRLLGPEEGSWRDAFAVGITGPEVQFGPGDVLIAHQQGTCGARATWGNNVNGVLTAGHIARTVGSQAIDRTGKTVGRIVQSQDPGVTNTGADVALIELAIGIPSTGPSLASALVLSGPTGAQVHRAAGPVAAQIVGKASWFHFSTHAGTYVDLYLTGQAVTMAGDSGAVVSESSTNSVVGHVVGASPGGASFIQDINFQLNSLKSVAGFHNLSV